MASSITYYQDQMTIDVYCPFGKSLSDVQAYVEQLGTYTAAGIFECTYTQAAQLNRAADPSKDAYPFHQYAKVILRRAADGKLYGLLLYAPVKSMFSYVEEQGYRVKQDVGTVLASYYSAMAGETFTFHKGWLQGQTFGA
jgi:hypothetical protein